MTTLSVTEARKRLYNLIDEVAESGEPVQITGKEAMRFLSARTTGVRCRRLCSSSLFPACESPSSKA